MARTAPFHPALFPLALPPPASLRSELVLLPLALPKVRRAVLPSAAKEFRPARHRISRTQALLHLELFPLVPYPPALFPRALPMALAVSDRAVTAAQEAQARKALVLLLPALSLPEPSPLEPLLPAQLEALTASDRHLRTLATPSSNLLAPRHLVLPILDRLAVIRAAVTVVTTVVSTATALARFLPVLLLLVPLPLALREVSLVLDRAARALAPLLLALSPLVLPDLVVRVTARARVHSPPASLHLTSPLLSLLLEASTIF